MLHSGTAQANGWGQERLKHLASNHGRLLTISPKEVDRSVNAFEPHGGKIVSIGRLIPAVGTLISVPAGISKMTLTTFLAYTTAGSLLWTSILAGAGNMLEKN